MSIRVEVNGRELTPAAGQSLFDCADQVDVRVPTSCRKNGKCRECLVEVTEGEDLLSLTSPQEAYLRQGFRLSCRACVVGSAGTIRCHTLRRGAMRIEREATRLDQTSQESRSMTRQSPATVIGCCSTECPSFKRPDHCMGWRSTSELRRW